MKLTKRILLTIAATTVMACGGFLGPIGGILAVVWLPTVAAIWTER